MARSNTSFAPPGFTPAGLCIFKVSCESRVHIAVSSGLIIKKWVPMIRQRKFWASVMLASFPWQPWQSRVSSLTSRPHFTFPKPSRGQSVPLVLGLIADFPEVITVSSTPQTQRRCPRCWTVLSAVPSSWLCSAPRVPALSGTAWCWKTWPIQ